MDKIEAKFQIVTPMYIGGANTTKDHKPQLSAKAIKSAIMFWWRALNYAHYSTLAELHERERVLFGGSRNGSKENTVSPVSFRIISKKVESVLTGKEPLSYLGYGINYKDEHETTQYRQRIRTGEFTLRLIKREGEICETVINAIKAFGLLGGLGARALKGFGSVSLISLNRDKDDQLFKKPTTMTSYLLSLKSLVSEIQCETSAVPSLHHCDIVQFQNETKPLQVLSSYNNKFSEYRKSKTFKNDGKWYNNKFNEENFHPQRVHFGLPHIYNKDFEIVPKDDHFKRRETPLRMHVHELNEHEYIGVLLHFKSDFLPKNMDYLTMTRPRNRNGIDVKHNTEDRFRVIDSFMNWEQLKTKPMYIKGEWSE